MLLDKIISEYMPGEEAIRVMSEFFAACGHETRMKMICLLSISPLNVGQIAKALEMNQTTVSHQLRVLRDRRIVACFHRGKETEYRIANDAFFDVLTKVAGITNARAEMLVGLLAKLRGGSQP